MNKDILSSVRTELTLHGDAGTRESAQRFFKEPVLVYGVKTNVVTKIARKWYPIIEGMEKGMLFSLCEDLLKSGYCEEAFIAFDWSYRVHNRYRPPDFFMFQNWIVKYVDNWAKCDVLCNHTVGAFIEQYPKYIDNLKQWALSENRWLRRAAAVSLIIPAKKGLFLKEIFQIAEILLTDKDDLVQKGYGWMLKEAGRLHQPEVFAYVIKNKNAMPRTALRYAIEKMPDSLRKQAMSK